MSTQLEAAIEYHFTTPGLLQRALTHRSATLAVDDQHMERLEFLGDAVLGLVIAQWLHKHFPERPEGELSRMRASLVRRESLLAVSRSWQLDQYLIVGDSERGKRGVKSPSIAANAVEAVIGAVFEDGGWERAQALILKAWSQMLTAIDSVDTRDAKSRLQELTQAAGWGLPQYELIDHGLQASPRFEARCLVQARPMGTGRGDRKKMAEMAAAEQAWQKLKK